MISNLGFQNETLYGDSQEESSTLPIKSIQNSSISERKKKILEDVHQEWVWKVEEAFKSVVESYTVSTHKCGNCRYEDQFGVIKCANCRKYCCTQCDKKYHASEPFHSRFYVRKDFSFKVLLPTEFINSSTGIIENQRM